ncbi:hypothetical protein PVAP13_3NG202804 [Panicum virgatum]|jgi:hypothetical protein|uniref:Uncharacterized protein n=1 Tax=Panicum virgatum TaxID=38727 RepID=A0A8T0UEJ7_PANVG|nr:hypothetical protein PVAP13_3NG202804 [Panicum virgatum]
MPQSYYRVKTKNSRCVLAKHVTLPAVCHNAISLLDDTPLLPWLPALCRHSHEWSSFRRSAFWQIDIECHDEGVILHLIEGVIKSTCIGVLLLISHLMESQTCEVMDLGVCECGEFD